MLPAPDRPILEYVLDPLDGEASVRAGARLGRPIVRPRNLAKSVTAE